jgi:hypothetical protein
MEAELVTELPNGDGWQYEPKWDDLNAGETVFPPRAPFFFCARLSQRAPQVGALPEDLDPGNLPVPHNPFPTAAHAAASTGWLDSSACRYLRTSTTAAIAAAKQIPALTFIAKVRPSTKA